MTVHAYATPGTLTEHNPFPEDESDVGPDGYREYQACWYVECWGQNGPEKFPGPLLEVWQRHFGANMIVGANFS